MNLYILCSPNAGTTRFELQDYDILALICTILLQGAFLVLLVGKQLKSLYFKTILNTHYCTLMSLEPFTCTIRKFKLRKVYGNIFNDRAVGFRTGCLYPYENPYTKFEGVNPFASSSHKLGQYVGCQIFTYAEKEWKRTGKRLGPVSLKIARTDASQNPGLFVVLS